MRITTQRGPCGNSGQVGKVKNICIVYTFATGKICALCTIRKKWRDIVLNLFVFPCLVPFPFWIFNLSSYKRSYSRKKNLQIIMSGNGATTIAFHYQAFLFCCFTLDVVWHTVNVTYLYISSVSFSLYLLREKEKVGKKEKRILNRNKVVWDGNKNKKEELFGRKKNNHITLFSRSVCPFHYRLYLCATYLHFAITMWGNVLVGVFVCQLLVLFGFPLVSNSWLIKLTLFRDIIIYNVT